MFLGVRKWKSDHYSAMFLREHLLRSVERVQLSEFLRDLAFVNNFLFLRQRNRKMSQGSTLTRQEQMAVQKAQVQHEGYSFVRLHPYSPELLSDLLLGLLVTFRLELDLYSGNQGSTFDDQLRVLGSAKLLIK